MKKTDKTALTAAAFAAALNIVPMGAAAYDPSEEPIQDVYGPPVYFETTTVEEMVPQPDYGPMPAWTTETTAVPEETTTDVTEIVPQPAYGPPIPTGDMNFDGKVDTFDLIIMRKLYAQNTDSEDIPYYSADTNNDGRFSIADLVTLNRFLLGSAKGLGPNYKAEVTAPPEDPIETTETHLDPVYGPPSWFGLETTTAITPEEDPVTTTENNYSTVYGPPSWFGGEDK